MKVMPFNVELELRKLALAQAQAQQNLEAQIAPPVGVVNNGVWWQHEAANLAPVAVDQGEADRIIINRLKVKVNPQPQPKFQRGNVVRIVDTLNVDGRYVEGNFGIINSDGEKFVENEYTYNIKFLVVYHDDNPKQEIGFKGLLGLKHGWNIKEQFLQYQYPDEQTFLEYGPIHYPELIGLIGKKTEDLTEYDNNPLFE